MNRSSMKCGTILSCLIYVQSLFQKEEGNRKIFEEIMAENFPNLLKNINMYIQEFNEFQEG